MDPQCSVCLDDLVAPVSFSCGHTTCLTCYRMLIKTGADCPECRGNLDGDLKINIVLDSLLAATKSNYEIFKKAKLNEIARETAIERYESSQRCSVLTKVLESYLSREGHTTMEQILLNIHDTLNPKPIADEVLYILKENFRMTQLKFKGDVYFISQNDVMVTHVKEFAVQYQSELEPHHLYKLASSLDYAVADMFKTLNLVKEEDLTYNKEVLADFLSGITIIQKTHDSSDDDDSEESSSESLSTVNSEASSDFA